MINDYIPGKDVEKMYNNLKTRCDNLRDKIDACLKKFEEKANNPEFYLALGLSKLL